MSEFSAQFRLLYLRRQIEDHLLPALPRPRYTVGHTGTFDVNFKTSRARNSFVNFHCLRANSFGQPSDFNIRLQISCLSCVCNFIVNFVVFITSYVHTMRWYVLIKCLSKYLSILD